MFKILFICHGNICRSPMAEFIFNAETKKRGLSDRLFAASAAVSREEIGNPVYPPVKRILDRKGISVAGKYAVQITREDVENYDLIIGMDSSNMSRLERYFGKNNKFRLLKSYIGSTDDIEDPWYTGNFESCFSEIETCVNALIDKLTDK